MFSFTDHSTKKRILTFQSRDVTSLLLGTSWPPSRIQCLSTNCVEPLVLFSLRFHILAVESPDLKSIQCTLNTLDTYKCPRIKQHIYILLLVIRQIKSRLPGISISIIFPILHLGNLSITEVILQLLHKTIKIYWGKMSTNKQ
jgi:hypothetical protein